MDARRIGFSVSVIEGTQLGLTANPVGAGSGVTFYLSYMSDAVPMSENFHRFCKCEYGDLITAAISAYSKAGAVAIQVTETLEIGE